MSAQLLPAFPVLSAHSAGDLQQAVRREVRNAMRAAQGDRFGAIGLGLARLRTDGLITARDLDHLRLLADVLQTVARTSEFDAATVERIRVIHHALAADSRSSEPALAIAVLIDDLVTATEPVDVGGSLAFRTARGRVEGGAAVLTGAIIGAGAGAEFGIGGVIAGAIIGGIAGGVAGECEITAG